jgi:hypothetical protein
MLDVGSRAAEIPLLTSPFCCSQARSIPQPLKAPVNALAQSEREKM